MHTTAGNFPAPFSVTSFLARGPRRSPAGQGPPPPSPRLPPRPRGRARLRREGCRLCKPEPGISRVSRALPAGLNPDCSPPAAPFPGTPSVEPPARCGGEQLPAPRPAPRGAHAVPGADPPPPPPPGPPRWDGPDGTAPLRLPRPGTPVPLPSSPARREVPPAGMGTVRLAGGTWTCRRAVRGKCNSNDDSGRF